MEWNLSFGIKPHLSANKFVLFHVQQIDMVKKHLIAFRLSIPSWQSCKLTALVDKYYNHAGI
jgi:hypothetical protein